MLAGQGCFSLSSAFVGCQRICGVDAGFGDSPRVAEARILAGSRRNNYCPGRRTQGCEPGPAARSSRVRPGGPPPSSGQSVRELPAESSWTDPSSRSVGRNRLNVLSAAAPQSILLLTTDSGRYAKLKGSNCKFRRVLPGDTPAPLSAAWTLSSLRLRGCEPTARDCP